MSASRRYYRCQ